MSRPETNLDRLLAERARIDEELRRHRSDRSVLFTDIVGSTAYFDRRGDTAGMAMLHHHAERASAAVLEAGGTVVKTIGDSLMASFGSPVAAVRASVQIQRDLREENRTRPEPDQVHVRIGIHHGPAFEHGGDLYGDAVNLAARVTKRTGPAQVLVTRAVVDGLREDPDLPCARVGSVTFEGKSHPEEVYEVVWTDAAIYADVRSRLMTAVAEGRLTSPGMESTELVGPAPSGERPERIGPYKVLEVLGEGGMGVVYLADQAVPIRRRVAVKLIKPGMDSREVLARFESERQALAVLSHPNVARVHDAGTTEAGRPYFVMEHVPGVPLTDYCDRHRLTTRERLELFLPVCAAIHHAHQKGIIHRDVKPTNVLVGLVDGVPVPKVIDFGVAKATEQRLTEKTLFTQLGKVVGTPEYMSPEQADPTALDIDTSTDVYSLGVMLYELLTGALPFDPRTLREGGYVEMQRIIREDDPPRPSTRVSTADATTAEVAKRRRTEPGTLRKQLKGDLDWITMRALEKDRTRRYASVSEFVEDLRRHLNQEPVHAGPPGMVYRWGKLLHRQRRLLRAVALTLLLAGAVAAILGGWLRARRATEERENDLAYARWVLDRVIASGSEPRDVSPGWREAIQQIGEEIARQPRGELALKAAEATCGARATISATFGLVSRPPALTLEVGHRLSLSMDAICLLELEGAWNGGAWQPLARGTVLLVGGKVRSSTAAEEHLASLTDPGGIEPGPNRLALRVRLEIQEHDGGGDREVEIRLVGDDRSLDWTPGRRSLHNSTVELGTFTINLFPEYPAAFPRAVSDDTVIGSIEDWFHVDRVTILQVRKPEGTGQCVAFAPPAGVRGAGAGTVCSPEARRPGPWYYRKVLVEGRFQNPPRVPLAFEGSLWLQDDANPALRLTLVWGRAVQSLPVDPWQRGQTDILLAHGERFVETALPDLRSRGRLRLFPSRDLAVTDGTLDQYLDRSLSPSVEIQVVTVPGRWVPRE